MAGMMVRVVVGAMMLVPMAAFAQDSASKSGEVASSSVGRVGQRQTRDTDQTNIEPLARFDSRVANRVQSRIRNRIDQDYDPTANATEPFKTAADKTKSKYPR